MTLFTYDTPRPRPGTLPEPGEWGDPIIINVEDDTEQPEHDYYPDGTPVEDEDEGSLKPSDDEPTIEDPTDPLEPPIEEPDPNDPPVEEPPPG